MDNERIEAYWQSYVDTILENSSVSDEQCEVEGFGDSPQMADELLGVLILSKTKSATCSALWELETEAYTLPEGGQKSIVLDGNDDPLWIIETTEVEVRPYNEVDALFTYEEGGGDRSLAYWRQGHWRFFSRTLPNIGKEPTPDMPPVWERFRVVREQRVLVQTQRKDYLYAKYSS